MSDQNTGHVNLGELNNFAKSLTKLAETIDTYLKNAESGLNQLGNTHRDEKYEEFKKKFEVDLKTLPPFVEKMKEWDKHIQNVWGKAIEDYLKTQMHK